MTRAAALLGLALAMVVAIGLALGPSSPEDRVADLSKGIRCPVCQAESIADSPSTTARAMVDIVAEQVEEGRTDDEIEAFFVARYGRWILLDPGVTPATVALWALPAAALLAGVGVVRRQTRRDGDERADDDEVERLKGRVAALREQTGHTDDQ